MLATEGIGHGLSDEQLRWAWSANLPHSVAIDRSSDQLLLRRWDRPDFIRKFKLPTKASGATNLLSIMKESGAPVGSDVVLHMLRAFRAIRFGTNLDDPLLALDRFNLLLLAAEAIDSGAVNVASLKHAKSFADVKVVLSRERGDDRLEWTSLELPDDTSSAPIMAFLNNFIAPEPAQRYVLVPSLLMRHTLGQIYQETHLVLEQEQHPQLVMPGFAPSYDGIPSRRDVRFTPASLARALVEESLRALRRDGVLPSTIDILDPACGSGVFLIEIARSLTSLGYQGRVSLRGIDISPLSVSMARFAVAQAAHDATASGLRVSWNVELADAIRTSWDRPDIVVMNPPFIPWESMVAGDQMLAREILGTAARGRVDMAMVFVALASRNVSDAGVVASVLPAALLETGSGEQWRSDLSERFRIDLIGRFEGFGYFRASAVEPSFVVLRSRDGSQVTEPMKVLVARETFEDDALRSLRRGDERLVTSSGSASDWDIYVAPQASLRAVSWLPRRRSDQQLHETLQSNQLPTVADLFRVRQGARTGANDAFLVDRAVYRSLPPTERGYFRPVAGNDTIRAGRLIMTEYVFYPFDAGGSLFDTEADLSRHMPMYYEKRLRPWRARLQDRAGIDQRRWWELTWPRTWQYKTTPKLVSTYFGDAGSFGYDTSGRFVVVQGHAWQWQPKTQSLESARLGIDGFHGSTLPWAYLALLNSTPFERVLATVCPRVQGGQFNLSSRFVGRVPIPDLRDEERILDEVPDGLAEIGRTMSVGGVVDAESLSSLVARAFGLSKAAAIADRTW
jgi:SAM-dependent methyltransferase